MFSSCIGTWHYFPVLGPIKKKQKLTIIRFFFLIWRTNILILIQDSIDIFPFFFNENGFIKGEMLTI